MNSLNLLSAISLFLIISLTPTVLSANYHSTPSKTCLQFSIASGGVVIVTQGIVSEPIILEYAAQKTTSKPQNIQVVIVATDGSIFYQTQTQSLTIDLSDLTIPVGSYTLIVTVDGELRTAAFDIL